METAVLEREEQTEIPAFNDSEWNRQIGDAGLPETKTDSDELGSTLEETLALPIDLKDLWPGHCYLPPRLNQVQKMYERRSVVAELWNDGKEMEAVEEAIKLLKPIVRRIDGEELFAVTDEEFMAEFNGDELAEISQHIFRQQGLIVEGVSGNAPSGRLIGAKSFHSSAATTPDTDLTTSEG